MKLNEIIDEIFTIASGIEYNTVSHVHPLLVAVRKEAKPEDLLLAIAAPLKQDMTNGVPISKTRLTNTLMHLKEIGKHYKIEELKHLTRTLESYIDSLD